MNATKPKLNTPAEITALKMFVRSGEVPASKIKKLTGSPAAHLMCELACNGWSWILEQVPALKSERPNGVKAVYKLTKPHRQLAADLINKRETGNDNA